MFIKARGRHWLSAQWALWQLDDVMGRLPRAGFRRWATLRNGKVEPVRGDGWGSHWQWGDLRLTDWGCWLQDDNLAWAFVATHDRFHLLDYWSIEAPLSEEGLPASPNRALEIFEQAALASESRWADPGQRWEALKELQTSGIVGAESARQWQMQIGAQVLPLCPWHQRALPKW